MANIIWDYIRSLWHYWWLCCLGFVLPINNVWKWLHPSHKELHFPFWLRLTIALTALFLAQFLVYKDQTKNLNTVIDEKRQLSIDKTTVVQNLSAAEQDRAALKKQVADLQSSPQRVVTNTVTQQEPHQCWLANHFGLPNSTIKEAVTATAAIIHCNHKIEAPFRISVEFDRDFIPGATVLPASGIVMTGEQGKHGRVYFAIINSPALLSNQLAIVTVYGRTDQFPRAINGGIQSLK